MVGLPLAHSLWATKAGIGLQLSRNAHVRVPGTDEPLVSVVIATYNRSDVLRVALASVLDQTHSHLQIIVVGDGCTDDSEAIVTAMNDQRVEWVGLERNSGSQSAPNNAGIQRARGEFVAYLGHDDVWLRNHVALAVRTLRQTAADLVMSGILGLGPTHSGIAMLANVGADPRQAAWHAPSCVVHRRATIEVVGEWRDFRTIDAPPDAEFIQRFAIAGRRTEFVPGLTVVKFPSAWEPGSYRTGTAQQQQAVFARSRSKLFFVEQELARYWWGRRRGSVPPPRFTWDSADGDPPRGWQVHLFRKARGLPPLESEEGGSPLSSPHSPVD
ncbi:MAG: glycosyltransferase family 2 protein [Actinomycetes bacterium]